MKLKIFQADAFAEKVFMGNPAAVVPLEEWLPDELMQNIALENNLSETAFFIEATGGFHIRWFTPAAEVDLCGHATLASAHILYKHLGYSEPEIQFNSRSGILKVEFKNGLYNLDFPASAIKETAIPENLATAFDFTPLECWQGRDDLMLIFQDEDTIRSLKPDFNQIEKSGCRGVIVAAKGNDFDFVSRFFAPRVGVNEDPVTGSAHTMLIPYWASILGKKEMLACQVSKRSGIVHCEHLGERVKIGGKAVTFFEGEITL